MLEHISAQELHSLYYDRYMTQQQIADIYGCSKPAICLKMKELGMTARHVSDYEPSEKQIAYAQRKGNYKKPYWSEASRAKARACGKANRGKRKRSDYEFGGHEKKRGDGYIVVYMPNHPSANKSGYVAKHRLVMESHIGRYLTKDEVVHHINFRKDDNRIENLKLMTKSEHMSYHNKIRNNNKRKGEK